MVTMRLCDVCFLRRTIMAAAMVVALAGCTSTTTVPVADEPTGVPEELAPASSAPAELCEAKLGSTSPVHAEGNLYLAGQPEKGDIAALAERGIKTVVTLRKTSELNWDEGAAVEAAGMRYVAIPFDGPEELTDDVFDRVRQVLKEHADEPVVLHCGKANRVGAVWMAHRVLDDGVGIEAALAEAKTVGLKTPAYAEKAQDYIRRAHGETTGAGASDDDAAKAR